MLINDFQRPRRRIVQQYICVVQHSEHGAPRRWRRFNRDRRSGEYGVKHRTLKFLFRNIRYDRRFRHVGRFAGFRRLRRRFNRGGRIDAERWNRRVFRLHLRIFVGKDRLFAFAQGVVDAGALQNCVQRHGGVEIGGRRRTPPQRRRDCAGHRPRHIVFLTEANLALRRMHINVEVAERHMDKQHARRIAPVIVQWAVAVAYSAIDSRRLHRTAVDKAALVAP